MDQDPEEPLVLRVVDRLAASYPETPREYIQGIVAAEYDTLDHARIRSYVPILVERSAWNRLHRETFHQPPS
jgi:hypothetical protein